MKEGSNRNPGSNAGCQIRSKRANNDANSGTDSKNKRPSLRQTHRLLVFDLFRLTSSKNVQSLLSAKLTMTLDTGVAQTMVPHIASSSAMCITSLAHQHPGPERLHHFHTAIDKLHQEASLYQPIAHGLFTDVDNMHRYIYMTDSKGLGSMVVGRE